MFQLLYDKSLLKPDSAFPLNML